MEVGQHTGVQINTGLVTQTVLSVGVGFKNVAMIR